MRVLPVLTLLIGAALTLGWAFPVYAQEATGASDGASLTLRSVQLLGLLTVLSVVPGIAIMVTCFPFVITVLSILRQAIGLQQSPPSMLMTTLAMFLTWYVMEPVFFDAWEAVGPPLQAGAIGFDEAFRLASDPFRSFMYARVAPETFANLAALRPDEITFDSTAPLSVLVPSFLLSEITRAFQVGFVLFLPFLVIDLVVAAILMSMGMMMVPPAIVSLPFKLGFFVVADGWSLVAAALVRGYG